MPESLVTKRLHISGLTPAITSTDLERRLSAFGTVKTMDGFGTRDALGDPRKFAYVTMEIGPKELAKCLNVLSGSTWKGAKLRLGEAKPDFRERIAQLNAMSPRPPRPKRDRIHSHGRPSTKLPLTPLSPDAAASTPGWVVTPSGRIVRPMRMRPARPLEPMHGVVSATKGKDSKVKTGKVKKRIKAPPVRARRRTIDPTKWDSVYLKGVFLESVAVLPSASTSRETGSGTAMEGIEGSRSSDEETSSADDSGYESSSEQESTPVQPTRDRSSPIRVPPPPLEKPQQSRTDEIAPLPATVLENADSIDLRRETATALALLGDMFADKDDWGGSESVDDMEDVVSHPLETRETTTQVDDEDEIEVVPRDYGPAEQRIREDKVQDTGKRIGDTSSTKQSSVDVGDADVEMADASVPANGDSSISEPTQAKLRDLFAPREEGASFSLLGHLDLDLELEDDILGIGTSTAGPSHITDPITEPTTAAAPQTVHITSTSKSHNRPSTLILDPSHPLMFPLPSSLPYPDRSSSDSGITATTAVQRAHQNALCYLIPAPPSRSSHKFNFLSPSSSFSRSPDATSESIRTQWENEKGALTREWKKAWREAKGSRRGKGVGGEE